MIEIKNVTKSYEKNKKIIDNLSLEIKDGEIFGFLGPNGAGKTTTIKMMTGILEIDNGEIFIDGNSIKKDPINAKKAFGFIPDSPDMFLKLKGIEYLNFIGDIYCIDSQTRRERIEKLANEFGIFEDLNLRIQNYSHGMRQKLLIVGVLMIEPKNWILDEPLTGLDPKSAHDLKIKMKEHKEKGNSVFFSTHVLDVAEKICDRIGIINNGKLIFVGTYEDMKTKIAEEGSLEDLFLKLTDK